MNTPRKAAPAQKGEVNVPNGNKEAPWFKGSWPAIFLAATLGTGGGAGYSTIFARVDPFTGTEALSLEANMKLWTIEYIAANVPPDKVTLRLDRIEKSLEQMRQQLYNIEHSNGTYRYRSDNDS